MKFFFNIQKTWTGTQVGNKNAADVYIANPSSAPFPIIEELDIKTTRFHQGSVTNINGSAGAWVALGGGAALSADIKELHITTTMGEPLEIGVGASAGAAQRKFIVNRGEGPLVLKINLSSGDQLWVRSLTVSGVTSGEIVMNLLGLP